MMRPPAAKPSTNSPTAFASITAPTKTPANVSTKRSFSFHTLGSIYCHTTRALRPYWIMCIPIRHLLRSWYSRCTDGCGSRRIPIWQYLGELTKFRVAPPMVVLRGLRRCLEDFTGYNIDIACCILESCGKYLYRMKHTHSRLEGLMDTMMRIKKARVRRAHLLLFVASSLVFSTNHAWSQHIFVPTLLFDWWYIILMNGTWQWSRQLS